MLEERLYIERYGQEGLGGDKKKLMTMDSFVIFEDMSVSPAMEKLIGQFKLCTQNVIKDLAINCRFICTHAALAHYKLCFNPLKQIYCSKLTRLITGDAKGCLVVLDEFSSSFKGIL